MLINHIERVIDKVINWLDSHGTWGQRVFMWWFDFKHAQCFANIKAKYIQDGCSLMTTDQWYEWFNTLTPTEFVLVMFLDKEELDQDFIAEAVAALSPEPQDDDV